MPTLAFDQPIAPLTYPRLPELAPRTATESSRAYGLRAFTHLLVERVPAHLLDTEALEQALHASQLLVTAPDLLDTTRTRYHSIRLQIGECLQTRRQHATQPPAHAPVPVQVPPPQDRDRGTHDRLPTPPVRPTAPAARVKPEINF